MTTAGGCVLAGGAAGSGLGAVAHARGFLGLRARASFFGRLFFGLDVFRLPFFDDGLGFLAFRILPRELLLQRSMERAHANC